MTVTILILFNYFIGLLILKQQNKSKNNIIIAIIINIIILILLKISGNINNFSNSILILPIGLSFIIFTILSYNFELLKGSILPERNFLCFATYILYFPKILQGPIERPQQFIEQLKNNNPIDYDNFVSGMKLICWGVFKKAVIADRASVITNNVFGNIDNFPGLAIILGLIIYSFQIYADFSGYIDIAIGSSNLLGIKLSRNFNSPYLSKSIKEFWDRWHITLSHWLRDYIFLPISYILIRKFKYFNLKNKTSENLVYSFSILITFIICGLWHGLTMSFVIWGLTFAIYLICSRLTSKLRKRFKSKLKISNKSLYLKIFQVLFTFSLVTISWVFFRTSNISDAFIIIRKSIAGFANISGFTDFAYIRGILSGFGLPEMELYILILSITFLIIVEFFQKGSNIFEILNNKPVFVKWLAYYFMIFIVLFLSYKGSNQDFIYLQF